MLVIRLQRTGRKGHASFRIVVQDSRKSPTSGKVVAYLGHYDPHTKLSKIDSEKALIYINNGAQPSEKVAGLLKEQKVKLPKWVKLATKKKKTTKNTEKLRKNQPADVKQKSKDKVEETSEEVKPEEEGAETETQPEVEPIEEKVEETPGADATDEKPAEPSKEETPPVTDAPEAPKS